MDTLFDRLLIVIYFGAIIGCVWGLCYIRSSVIKELDKICDAEVGDKE